MESKPFSSLALLGSRQPSSSAPSPPPTSTGLLWHYQVAINVLTVAANASGHSSGSDSPTTILPTLVQLCASFLIRRLMAVGSRNPHLLDGVPWPLRQHLLAMLSISCNLTDSILHYYRVPPYLEFLSLTNFNDVSLRGIALLLASPDQKSTTRSSSAPRPSPLRSLSLAYARVSQSAQIGHILYLAAHSMLARIEYLDLSGMCDLDLLVRIAHINLPYLIVLEINFCRWLSAWALNKFPWSIHNRPKPALPALRVLSMIHSATDYEERMSIRKLFADCKRPEIKLIFIA